MLLIVLVIEKSSSKLVIKDLIHTLSREADVSEMTTSGSFGSQYPLTRKSAPAEDDDTRMGSLDANSEADLAGIG